MKQFFSLLLLFPVFNCIAQDSTKVGINNPNPLYHLDINGSLRSSDSVLVGILRAGSAGGYIVTWDSVTKAFTKIPASTFVSNQTLEQTLTNGKSTSQYVRFMPLNGATGNLLTPSIYGFRSIDTTISGGYRPLVFRAAGSGLGDWSITHNSIHLPGQTGYNEPLWIGYNIDQAKDSGAEIHFAIENNWRQPGHSDDDRWFESHLEVYTSRDSIRYRPFSWIGGKRTAYGQWMFRSNAVDFQDPKTGGSYLSGSSVPSTGAFFFTAQSLNGTTGIRFQGTGIDNHLYIDAIPAGQTALFRDFNSIRFGNGFIWNYNEGAESLKVPTIEQSIHIGRRGPWPVMFSMEDSATFGMGDLAAAYFTMSTDGGTGEHSYNVNSGYWHSFKVNGVEKARFKGNGFLLPAGTTANAPVNIAQGDAPSIPVNGDIWTTSSSIFAHINGTTIDLAGGEGGGFSFNTSAELAALLGDETGVAGSAVFSNSPTINGSLNFNWGGAVLDNNGGGSFRLLAADPITIQSNYTGTGDLYTLMAFEGQTSPDILALGSSESMTATQNILQASSSSSTMALIKGDGKVGIGIDSSNEHAALAATLQVLGSVRFDLGSDATGDMIYRGANGNLVHVGIGTTGKYWMVTDSGVPGWSDKTVAQEINDSLNVLRSNLERHYTATIVTTNSTPATALTIPINAGEAVLVEVTVLAVLIDGNASYHAKKMRGFLKNATGILSEDETITDLMPDKYRGAGLSSPTFTIKLSGSDIIVETIGEEGDTLTWNFTFTILRHQTAF